MVTEMDDLIIRVRASTKELEKEVLLLELSRLRKMGIIDFEIYKKAREIQNKKVTKCTQRR